MSDKLIRLAFVTILVVTLVLSFFLKNLRFNYVFESFFPTDDPDLEYYQQFEQIFENDNNYLLIGLVHRPSVFDSVFLLKVKNLTSNLEHINHIKNVKSLTNIKTPIISAAGYFEIPVVHPAAPGRFKKDSIRIYQNPLLTASLISSDGTSTAIIVKHHPLPDKVQSDSLVMNIQQQIASFNFEEVHLAGKTYAQGVFIDKMQYELLIFLSSSIILVMLFLAITFRTWWGVLIPLIVVMLSAVWILGIMGMTGKTLDILMVLLPTIMFVVGMSDVVHIMTKYIEQLRIGDSKADAIKVTIKEVGMATFLTSLTTAVGFLTLLTASIKPIREFGLYTAIGVFMAFIVAFALMPACLMLAPKPRISKNAAYQSAWMAFLSSSFIHVLKYRNGIMLINVLLIAVSLYGISQIRINTYLIEDLPKDDPLKQGFIFFDHQFGGSRPFEITATIQDSTKSIFDKEILHEIDKVQRYLAADFKAGNIISPLTIVKGLNQALNGGTSEAYTLPKDEKGWEKIEKYIQRLTKREDTQMLIAQNGKIGRISSRVGDIGSSVSLKRTKELQQYVKNNTDASLVEFRVTGTSNLIDKNNEYLSKNMFQGLGIAFLVVALIAGLLFKSFRMILIALIPNIIPLLIVAGIMGIFGISLKLSTSIIFTIAFGIAVDDTIHFISKLRIEISKGKPLLYALKRTYLSTGKAIIITSIILSGGFLILLLSSFGGTFYTGLLISLSLVFALIIDLSLLPVLIMLFYKKIPKFIQ